MRVLISLNPAILKNVYNLYIFSCENYAHLFKISVIDVSIHIQKLNHFEKGRVWHSKNHCGSNSLKLKLNKPPKVIINLLMFRIRIILRLSKVLQVNVSLMYTTNMLSSNRQGPLNSSCGVSYSINC